MRVAGAVCGRSRVRSSTPRCSLPGRAVAAGSDSPQLLDEVAVDSSGRVLLAAWDVALAEPGTVVAALQSANGEVGTRQPLEAAWEACRARGVPLVVDAQAGLGRDAVPDAYDVLVGDARSWGGPAGVGVLVVPERTRWRRPGAVSEAEFGRTDAEPVVPLVLAAAEAWLATAADRADESISARELVDAGPARRRPAFRTRWSWATRSTGCLTS